MLEKTKKTLDKKQSKEVTGNWYFALGAAQITGSFYAPDEDRALVLILSGCITVTVAALFRYGKGEQ